MVTIPLRFIPILIIISLSLTCTAQQVPDLISSDNYRPYLNEAKKRDQYAQNYSDVTRKKYPQTSEELYPNLYKGNNIQLPPGINGSPADPYMAIGRYGSQSINGPQSPLPSTLNSFDDRTRQNLMIVESDIAAEKQRQILASKYVNEAAAELYKPKIIYHLGSHQGEKVAPFIKAESVLTAMLNGSTKIDFMQAVFLVESAVDNTLTWEEFNQLFRRDIQVIGAIMQKEKLSTTDSLAKVMAIYKFMTDTTKVMITGKEKLTITKPMLYDFEDYEAKKDLTKVFVSKLLRTGTGQCMSLPTLFFLYSKAMNANVNLAFAPEHSYITFKDHRNNTQNIELTGRMFTTTDFYWQTGFIKAEQVKSGIYLKPLSDNAVLVHLLTTLARCYVRTFGTDERLLEMSEIAKKYAPNDLSANMLSLGYKRDLYRNILRQYDVFRLPQAEFDSDERRIQIEKEMNKAYDRLMKDLGYAKMPEWAYKQWLDGVNRLANKQQHLVRKRQLEQQLNR